jgi:probable addiction module antidote protein
MAGKTIKFEDELIESLKDEEYQRIFLNTALEEYVVDGEFKYFFKSLEYVIKARGSVSGFSKKTKLNRRNLYSMFKGEQKPQLDTVVKVLHELGYSLKIA